MKRIALAAFASVGLAGAALADPVVLGATQLDSVTASGTVDFETTVTKTVNIDKVVNLDVDKNVLSNVELDGTLATAEGSADSINFFNNLAEVDTFAQVQPGGAFAFAESLAAGTDGFDF